MTGSRILYAAIVIVAFIFSQALYDPISLFTLICVLLLPLISLVCMLIGSASVHVKCAIAKREIYRFEQSKLLAEIRCGFPLISPVMTLYCKLPEENGDRSLPRRLHISFTPRAKTTIEIPFSFGYRGIYQIGAQTIEICDFLRLFRMHKRIDKIWNVRVMPRLLSSDLALIQRVFLDEGSGTEMIGSPAYAAEIMGVRDYEDGEPLRFVHWNLSAVRDKLMVKSFASVRQQQVYLLLDLTDPEPAALSSRRLGDAMVETVLSVAREYLDHIGAICMMWNAGDLQRREVSTPQQLATVHTEIALCPMQSYRHMDEAMDKIGEVQELCVVVGRLNDDKMRRIEVLRHVVRCPITLLAFEYSATVSAESLLGKNIRLQMLDLAAVEEGRLA